jgi:hypothetical protein
LFCSVMACAALPPTSSCLTAATRRGHWRPCYSRVIAVLRSFHISRLGAAAAAAAAAATTNNFLQERCSCVVCSPCVCSLTQVLVCCAAVIRQQQSRQHWALLCHPAASG